MYAIRSYYEEIFPVVGDVDAALVVNEIAELRELLVADLEFLAECDGLGEQRHLKILTLGLDARDGLLGGGRDLRIVHVGDLEQRAEGGLPADLSERLHGFEGHELSYNFV